MLVPLLLLLFAEPRAQAASQPSLDQLLDRVAQYVMRFQDDFAIVISDEQYDQKGVVQEESARIRSRARRRIRSETVFAWLLEQQSWLTARKVLSVDGAPVPDSEQRLDAVLGEIGPARNARLQRLRDEGARFNIGRIYRNFNDPTFVLQFLTPALQSRFVFTMLGVEKDSWKVAFSERAIPTVIQTPTSKNLLSSGTVWIGRADAAIVRTQLVVKDPSASTTAEIAVDYRFDPRLGIAVPVRMAEVYTEVTRNVAPAGSLQMLLTTRERIECVAMYSNYRRFETSGRLVPP
jgi:hypothetical protein